MKYSMNIIWSDNDNGFIVTVPEFSNLSAFGETYEEAIKSAKEAVEGYVEVLNQEREEVPAPSDLCEYSGQFRLRLTKTQHKELAFQARKEGVSLNSLILSLLAEKNAYHKVKALFAENVKKTTITQYIYHEARENQEDVVWSKRGPSEVSVQEINTSNSSEKEEDN